MNVQNGPGGVGRKRWVSHLEKRVMRIEYIIDICDMGENFGDVEGDNPAWQSMKQTPF